MHHNLLKRKLPVTALCMALVLAGCNSDVDGSNGDSTESLTSGSISAQNATFVTDYADSYQVDLFDKVLVSDNDSFTLVDVTSLSATPECQLLGQSDHSFTIGAESAKSCDYQYRVKLAQSNLTDSAITRVAVTYEASGDTSAVELNAISVATLVEQTLDVTDIKSLLKSQTGFDVEEGFVLSDVVSLPYSDNVATVEPSTDTISYTPLPGFQGIERILFSYINDATDEVLLGTLDVAVAQEANLGFSVDENITHPPVNVNETTEIDISKYVHSTDNDDYQLVYVDSFNAATAPLNDDVDNKILTFETSKPGAHYISFAVSDHNGAYAMGLIELYALDPNRARPWGDIYDGPNRYTGPLTIPETSSQGIAYEGGLLDNFYNPPVEVALFTYAQAQAYCGTNGRLPTSSELQSLMGLGVQSNYEWPLSGNYLASDEGIGVVVNLESGESNNYSSGGYIVTCVNVGGLALMTEESSYTDIVANGIDKAKIVAQLTFDGKPAEGQFLDISVPSSASAYAIDDSSVETDEDGKATFYISSLIAQSFLATIDFYGMEVGASVSFVGDVKNAILTQSTEKNNQEFGGNNSVRTRLVDIYGNGISGQQIEISGANVKINGTANSATATTDSNGEIDSSIAWNGSTSNSNQTVEITSTFTEGAGGSGQTASSNVTFVAPLLTIETTSDNADTNNSNWVKVKLTDTDNNPLSGRSVYVKGPSYNVSIDGSPYSETLVTKSDGTFSTWVAWIGSDISEDQNVTITAVYGSTSATTDMTFKKPMTYHFESSGKTWIGTGEMTNRLLNENGESVTPKHCYIWNKAGTTSDTVVSTRVVEGGCYVEWNGPDRGVRSIGAWLTDNATNTNAVASFTVDTQRK
ncbi:hypothetical protein ABK988_22890 [Vibrio parahaemolyticus]|nr:hypothetical protein [Vibrio parahaemolyticus]